MSSLHFTLGEIARREVAGAAVAHCRLYVIRDGEEVLYIGQAADPLKRVAQHLRAASYPSTAVWSNAQHFDVYLLSRGAADWEQWTVQFLTPAEAADLVRTAARGWEREPWAVAACELFLIGLLRARENITGQYRPDLTERRAMADRVQW